jgi:hypothetical protein
MRDTNRSASQRIIPCGRAVERLGSGYGLKELCINQRDITNGDIFLSTSRASNASYIPRGLHRLLDHHTRVATPICLPASAHGMIRRYTRSWSTPKDCEE